MTNSTQQCPFAFDLNSASLFSTGVVTYVYNLALILKKNNRRIEIIICVIQIMHLGLHFYIQDFMMGKKSWNCSPNGFFSSSSSERGAYWLPMHWQSHLKCKVLVVWMLFNLYCIVIVYLQAKFPREVLQCWKAYCFSN